MSKTIGSVRGFNVMASEGGVELHGESVANTTEQAITIAAHEALDLASLLTRAALEHVNMMSPEEAERHRTALVDTYRRALAKLESAL